MYATQPDCSFVISISLYLIGKFIVFCRSHMLTQFYFFHSLRQLIPMKILTWKYFYTAFSLNCISAFDHITSIFKWHQKPNHMNICGSKSQIRANHHHRLKIIHNNITLYPPHINTCWLVMEQKCMHNFVYSFIITISCLVECRICRVKFILLYKHIVIVSIIIILGK